MKPSFVTNATGNYHHQAEIIDNFSGAATLCCVSADRPEQGDIIRDKQGVFYVALAPVTSAKPYVTATDLLALNQRLTISRTNTSGKAFIVAEDVTANVSTTDNAAVKSRLDHVASAGTDLHRRALLREQLADIQKLLDPTIDIDLVQTAGDFVSAYDAGTTIVIESAADIELGDIVIDQDGHAFLVEQVDRRSLRRLWVITATAQRTKPSLKARIFGK